jgi:hypothetical protein
MDVLGFPTGPISANTWNLKKKKNKFPVPCPFALHANPLDCRARFKHTRLGSFFEGFV